MAFKVVGVKSVVKGFGKFMSDIQAVTKATTDSTRKITLELQKEAAVRRKLRAQIDQQLGRYRKACQ